MRSRGSAGGHQQQAQSAWLRSCAMLIVAAVGIAVLAATLVFTNAGEARGAVHITVRRNAMGPGAIPASAALKRHADGGEPVGFKVLETGDQLLQEARTPGGPLANVPSWVHSFDGPPSSSDVKVWRYALKFLPEFVAVLPMTFDSQNEEIDYFLLRSPMSMTSLVSQLKATARKFGADEKVVLTRIVVLHGKTWSGNAHCSFDRYVGSGPPGTSASCDVIYNGQHNAHYDASVTVNNPEVVALGKDTRAATPPEALTMAQALEQAAMNALRSAEQSPRNILPADLIAAP